MSKKTSVTRNSNGLTVVRVTLREGDLTATWAVKSYGSVREAYKSADSGARKALAEMREEA